MDSAPLRTYTLCVSNGLLLQSPSREIILHYSLLLEHDIALELSKNKFSCKSILHLKIRNIYVLVHLGIHSEMPCISQLDLRSDICNTSWWRQHFSRAWKLTLTLIFRSAAALGAQLGKTSEWVIWPPKVDLKRLIAKVVLGPLCNFYARASQFGMCPERIPKLFIHFARRRGEKNTWSHLNKNWPQQWRKCADNYKSLTGLANFDIEMKSLICLCFGHPWSFKELEGEALELSKESDYFTTRWALKGSFS